MAASQGAFSPEMMRDKDPQNRRPARARDPRSPEGVLDALKRDAVTALGGVLSGFWSSIEEQVRLAALASHDYVAVQEDRMAVAELSQRALEFASRFRESIESEFRRWERPAEAQAPAKSLTLMSEGELEIQLAGQQITELLEHQFLHPLTQLDERMKALAALMGIAGGRPNPLRPEVAVKAFVGLFGAQDLTPGLRAMVFQHLDKRLPKILGEIYERSNAALDSLASRSPGGVRTATPEGGRRPPADSRDAGSAGWEPDGGLVEQRSSGAGRTGGGLSQGGMGEETPASARARAQVMSEAMANGQPLRYRDLVREQLRQWRERGGGSFGVGGTGGTAGAGAGSDRSAVHGASRSAGAASRRGGEGGGSHVLGMDELLSIADLMQGEDAEPYARALAGEDQRPLGDVLRHRIFSSLREIGFDPASTRFSTDDEDAIDLVSILFQTLFEATDMVSQSRELYGRLVVPYLKLTLTDDSLFNRRSHPARQLLDALTEACDGNAGETPQDREMLERAEQVVDRVVREYSDDQAIFELAASELRDQLDQQRRRAELTEKRAAEAIHGRERLQQARLDADGLVASRMADRPLTDAVAFFLDRHWRHHLTQTWLRDGPGSERHRAAIGLGDAMVQVDADAAAARGTVVADQLLALQSGLAECYSSCGMDAGAAQEAMARVISALALPDTRRRVQVPQSTEEGSQGQDPDLRVAGGTDTLDYDPAIAARMRRLRVGQGLRLIDEDGHETAARIAWISPLTSRFLIVNRRGVRRMVVSPEELAALVADGRVLLRVADAPFDEAMRQLWQRLNAPPESPGTTTRRMG